MSVLEINPHERSPPNTLELLDPKIHSPIVVHPHSTTHFAPNLASDEAATGLITNGYSDRKREGACHRAAGRYRRRSQQLAHRRASRDRPCGLSLSLSPLHIGVSSSLILHTRNTSVSRSSRKTHPLALHSRQHSAQRRCDHEIERRPLLRSHRSASPPPRLADRPHLLVLVALEQIAEADPLPTIHSLLSHYHPPALSAGLCHHAQWKHRTHESCSPHSRGSGPSRRRLAISCLRATTTLTSCASRGLRVDSRSVWLAIGQTKQTESQLEGAKPSRTGNTSRRRNGSLLNMDVPRHKYMSPITPIFSFFLKFNKGKLLAIRERQ